MTSTPPTTPSTAYQIGCCFHGDYRYCCYVIRLRAELRKSDRGVSRGIIEALQECIHAIRKRLGNEIIIIVRGDSGFCRDDTMIWIESQSEVC